MVVPEGFYMLRVINYQLMEVSPKGRWFEEQYLQLTLITENPNYQDIELYYNLIPWTASFEISLSALTIKDTKDLATIGALAFDKVVRAKLEIRQRVSDGLQINLVKAIF